MAGKSSKKKAKGLLGAATKVASTAMAPAKLAKGVTDFAAKTALDTAVSAANEAGKLAAEVGSVARAVVPGVHKSGGKGRKAKRATRTADTRSPAAAVAAEKTKAKAAAAAPRNKPANAVPSKADKAGKNNKPAKQEKTEKAGTQAKAERPVKAEKVPPRAEKVPARAERVPAKAEKVPARAEKASAKAEKVPTRAEKPSVPARAEKVPPRAEKRSVPAKAEKPTKPAKPSTISPVTEKATAPETASVPAPPSVGKTTPGGTNGTGDLPEKDLSVRPKGLAAEQAGKQDEVTRQTGQPSVAANYRTRSPEVMTAWAKARGGEPRMTPAKIGGVLNLRFEFTPGQEPGDWDAFLKAFAARDADFIYQERVRDGGISHTHRFARAAKA